MSEIAILRISNIFEFFFDSLKYCVPLAIFDAY